MSARHLYAIIPTGDEVVFDVAGVDDRGRVYTVPHQDFAAVVSPSVLVDYRGLNRDQAVRHLLAHQRVVDAVMRDFPVLPFKFGAVLSDEPQVRHLLAQGEPLFRAMLEKFAGRVQVEVVILWNVQEIFESISQEEQIARLKAKLAGRPPEETLNDRVALGQMVQVSLERRRSTLQTVLIPLLQDLALEVVLNPLMDDSMVANVALLVDEARLGDVDRGLELLDSMSLGHLNFRRIGPLPPYSFASIEVRSSSFDEVDEARRRLGLAETATADEIKRAYRRMAGEAHPDRNPDDPEAETHLSELICAHDLLTSYAESCALGDGHAADQPVVCRFDRPTVESTLLISVRRQESHLEGE